MLAIAIDILAALLGVHALIKFTVFFVIPYAARRRALDKAYGDRPTATKTADAVLLALTVVIAGLVIWRGLEATSFLAGLWIGATLIQLYFHRFHEPLPPEVAPPPVVSPIKLMSYAIQAAPRRPWPEMLVMATLIVFALVLISRRYF
jgi:hypothetical protein